MISDNERKIRILELPKIVVDVKAKVISGYSPLVVEESRKTTPQTFLSDDDETVRSQYEAQGIGPICFIQLADDTTKKRLKDAALIVADRIGPAITFLDSPDRNGVWGYATIDLHPPYKFSADSLDKINTLIEESVAYLNNHREDIIDKRILTNR